MLSYRHAFHAGNHADVLKHAVFVFVLRYLQRKEAPLLVLDSHAGAGLYDLRSPEAVKLGEYQAGIGRILALHAAVPELLHDYVERVRTRNRGGALARYPGSPVLAAALRRPQDRLALFELHPQDHAALAATMAREHRVSVHKEDGLKGLIGHMPPTEKRALALIDPSYEIKTDYETVPAALVRAWKRFPTGVYMVWYPVIERARSDALTSAIVAAGVTKLYRIELGMAPDAPGRGMTGSGLLVVNPPYTLPAAAQAALPWLAGVLQAKGPQRVEWLAGE